MPAWDNLEPVSNNVNNILLPPLRIKLDLMKNYVKSLVKEGQAFAYLQHKFPYISDAKLKAGIFNGHQIRELMRDVSFDEIMNVIQLRACLVLLSQ